MSACLCVSVYVSVCVCQLLKNPDREKEQQRERSHRGGHDDRKSTLTTNTTNTSTTTSTSATSAATTTSDNIESSVRPSKDSPATRPADRLVLLLIINNRLLCFCLYFIRQIYHRS